jgi:hypothetical protein
MFRLIHRPSSGAIYEYNILKKLLTSTDPLTQSYYTIYVYLFTCLHIHEGRPADTIQTERVYKRQKQKKAKHTYANIT